MTRELYTSFGRFFCPHLSVFEIHGKVYVCSIVSTHNPSPASSIHARHPCPRAPKPCGLTARRLQPRSSLPTTPPLPPTLMPPPPPPPSPLPPCAYPYGLTVRRRQPRSPRLLPRAASEEEDMPIHFEKIILI